MPFVRNGDNVLFHVKDDKTYINRIVSNGTIELYRKRLQGAKFIGLQYNQWFYIQIEGSEPTIVQMPDVTMSSYSAVVDKDTGNSLDLLHGETRTAIADGDAFQQRETEFSRFKLVNRAVKRHLLAFTMELVEPYQLVKNSFRGKMPGNAMFLSPDNFGLLIQLSGVSRIPGFSRCLIYDDVNGYVAAGVAQRLALTDTISDPTAMACTTLKEGLQSLMEELTSKQLTLQERVLRAREYYKKLLKDLKIPPFPHELAVVTGKTTGNCIKSVLSECNMLPFKTDLEGSRPNISPFIAPLGAHRFASDETLSRLGYTLMDSPDDTTIHEPSELWTPKTMYRALRHDHENWVSRRVKSLGIDLEPLFTLLHDEQRGLREYISEVEDSEEELYFDSLIVATRSRPLPLIRLLMQFVRPAAPVVIFSSCGGALAELNSYIIRERCGILTSLYDNRALSFQVLPHRTRPAMLGESFGGYLLSYYAQVPTIDDGSVTRKAKDCATKKNRKVKG